MFQTRIEAPAPYDELNPRERIGRVLAISVPIILALSSQNLLNIVDIWIVGQLGALELAAVALGSTTNWMLSAFFIGLGAGVQAIVSRRVGEGRLDDTVAALNRSIYFTLWIVVPFTLFVSAGSEFIMNAITTRPDIEHIGTPYLAARLAGIPFVAANFAFRGYWNGLGLSRLYMKTLVSIHILNIGLSFLLVFGIGSFDGFGVFGAGIGSTIAQAFGTAYYFHLARHHGVPKGFLRPGHSTSLRELLRLGVPFGIQSLLFSVGFLIFFIITDRIGAQELGASEVLVTMALVSILPGVGMGLGAASLVGQSLGAGRPDDARKWGWLAMIMGCVLCGGIGLIESITAPWWMHWFIPTDPEAAALGIPSLRIIGAIMAIDAIGIVLSNSMIGAGATTLVMITSVACQYFLFLPLAYAAGLVLGWGITWMWVAFAIYRFVFSAICMVLWRGKRWQIKSV